MISTARPRSQIDQTSHVDIEQFLDCPPQTTSSVDLLIPIGKLRSLVHGSRYHRVVTHFQRQKVENSTAQSNIEMVFHWSTTSKYLSDFRGIVRFQKEHEKIRTTLRYRYNPRFGSKGGFFDSIIGSRIANATANDLIHRLTCVLQVRAKSIL